MISTQVQPPREHLLSKAIVAVQRTITRTASRVAITFSRARTYGWPAMMPNSRYNYQAMVGNGSGNSIVMALLLWICRTFPEAPIQVYRHEANGTADVRTSHPMTDLLARPNEFYSGPLLWMATLLDYLRGDAYWIKVRSGGGRPVELWYVPSDLMQPKWPDDGSAFISHYEYSPNGYPIKYAIEDVVHFRNGMDPMNPRKGLTILGSLFREIYSDDEAANFTASLLRNLGVPGVILAPGENDGQIDPDAADQIKGKYKERFNGDNRGEPLVLSAKMTATVLSFSPQQMDLAAMRRVPEERVSAILGVSPMVVGLGAGLNASCVPAYARVQTPNGTKTIAELDEGSIVWSFKDGRIVPRMVEHKWDSGRAMVYEVRTANRRIRATGNHPFMVRVPGSCSGGGNERRHASYEWRKLEELKAGDYIVQAKAYPDQGGDLLPDGRIATPSMLQFLGAVIGDGTVTPGAGVRIAMPPNDRCVEHYRELALSLFTRYQSGGERPYKRAVDGLTSKFVDAYQAGESFRSIGRRYGMNNATVRDRILTSLNPKPVVTAPIVLQTRERDFGFSSAQASRWLADLGVSGRAHTKRVPSWVYGLNRELRLAFLAGIVDSDGYVDARGSLCITFCNRALVDDVRDLMISLGMRVCNVGHRTMSVDVLPNPGTQESYEAWMFTASSARQVAEIPFSDPLYRQRVEANQQRHRPEGKDARKAGLSEDLGFAQIKSIEPIGEDDVFDLTVEDGHSFFCENALISNTYSNMREAKEAAWENCLVPTMRLLAAELRTQLLDDFETDSDMDVRFDLSKVRALQGDLTDLYRQATMGMAAGMLTRSMALAHVNLPSTDDDNVYVQSSLLVTVPIGGAAPPAPGSPVQAPPPASALVPAKEHIDPAFKSIWENLSPDERQALLTELTPASTNGNGKH